MTAAALATLAARYLLVMLFFPFSAADKIFNFKAPSPRRARSRRHNFAVILILAGLATEILMPLAILTGIADRAAAFVLAGYCMVTALLWKQFWKPGDFWRAGDSKGRDLFWDFLKNFSLAGGLPAAGRRRPWRDRNVPRRPARLVSPLCAGERAMTDSGSRPTHRLLASLARRNGRQPSAALRTDGVRAQGRRSSRSAMEQPPAARRSHDRLYRAAGRLGRGLARKPGAAVDRAVVRPVVGGGDGRDAGRDGSGRPVLRRGPRLHRNSGRPARPSVGYDRRRARGSDDRSVACAAGPAAVSSSVR